MKTLLMMLESLPGKEMKMNCVICGKEAGNGYAKCEGCGRIYCNEHSSFVDLYRGEALCPTCKIIKQLEDIRAQITDINKSLGEVALGTEVARHST